MSDPTRAVCLVTGNHLCHNPRVIKGAAALAEAGFDVEVLGGWFSAAMKARDQRLMQIMPFRYTPVVDLSGSDGRSRLRRSAAGVRRRIGLLSHAVAGLESTWQLGPAAQSLGAAARKRKAALFIAHSEAALPVIGNLLGRGCRVGVDMEDWYSEDLLPEARKGRPLRMLQRMEAELLGRGAFSSCPSDAMSVALASAYSCCAPTVIYNAFPLAERDAIDGKAADRADTSIPSIHWYSQTLGEGRGLEELVAALPMISHPAELHLRGNPAAGFDRWLIERLPSQWRGRVFLHGLVDNDQLMSRIAEHDIGFAGEMQYCRSRDLTITNKILQYLLAGLAVVASDTAGQKEVARQAPGAVMLYASGDTTALANLLNALLSSRVRLETAKRDALAAAKRTFCWERQEGKLLEAIDRAIASPLTGAKP